MNGQIAAPAARRLPLGSPGRLAPGWSGMLALLVTEGALFAYLLFSYFYLASQSTGAWPPDGPPRLALAAANTLILLASSACAIWAERGIRLGRKSRLIAGLAGALALGIAFAAIQFFEWRSRGFTLSYDAYGSLYFTITGFHMAHVIAGLLMLAAMLSWSMLGYFDSRRHAAISIGTLYWHFVDAVWVAVFAALYLTPYLT